MRSTSPTLTDRGLAWIDDTHTKVIEVALDMIAHQLGITVGRAIDDLEILAQAGTAEDFANRVEYLPL